MSGLQDRDSDLLKDVNADEGFDMGQSFEQFKREQLDASLYHHDPIFEQENE